MSKEITTEMIVEALERAFRSAEGNSALSGLHALTIEHYRSMKQALRAGQMSFEEASMPLSPITSKSVKTSSRLNRWYQ